MKKIKIAQIGIGHDHALELLHCIVNHTDIFEGGLFAEEI